MNKLINFLYFAITIIVIICIVLAVVGTISAVWMEDPSIGGKIAVTSLVVAAPLILIALVMTE